MIGSPICGGLIPINGIPPIHGIPCGSTIPEMGTIRPIGGGLIGTRLFIRWLIPPLALPLAPLSRRLS